MTLSGKGDYDFRFAPLAYAVDAVSAPGLVVAGASMPGYRICSGQPALAGTVQLAGSSIAIPLAVE